MSERWLPVVGYEGLYEVSDFGNVRSLARSVNSKGGSRRSVSARPMKIAYSRITTEYGCVTLSNAKKEKTHSLHRLVAQAFLPNPFNKKFVNHRDNNPRNNHATNLEWCTAKENTAHAIKIGAIRLDSKEMSDRGKKGAKTLQEKLGHEQAVSAHFSRIGRIRKNRV